MITKQNWTSRALLAAVIAAFLALVPSSQAQSSVQAQTVVTVMPKDKGQAVPVNSSQVQVKVNNNSSQVTEWNLLHGPSAGVQVVVLIDDSARSSLSLQLRDIATFIQQLPPEAQVGVAYMQNGRAVMAQNLTADRALAAKALRIPQGTPGQSASPYFCLSDLVKHWPSSNMADRREVLMITDGVDLYYGARYDPDDPYVQAAITDSQKAGVIVYSIFYKDSGRFDNSSWTEGGAQNYLLQVSKGTGGNAYWQGFGNPVSFVPFLDDLSTRLKNQYELGFMAKPGNKTELQQLKVKVNAPNVSVDAPERVLIPGSEASQR